LVLFLQEEMNSKGDEDIMKTNNLILLVFILLGTVIATTSASPSIGATFGIFYSNLAVHGEWIGVEGGTYAWRPRDVDAGWRPYLEGRWMWTDDGWYWDSVEPWAWATYHYGRWYYDDDYGWLWIPGYDWAPAWVEWRYGGDYVGWAPLGPYAVFNPHFGVHYLRPWVTPYHYWAFVDCRYITSPGVHQYVYRSEQNTRFIGRTRTAGSVRYDGGRIVSRGPEVTHVEKRGNIRVDRAALVDVTGREDARVRRTGDREQIGVYRPRIETRDGDIDVVRPPDVKDRERMPSLETRSMDIRQRENARDAGRAIEKMDPSRSLRSEDRTLDRARTNPEQRSAPTERRPKYDRESQRRGNGEESARAERRSVPRVDRPSMRSAPEGRSAAAPDRRSGERPGSGQRQDRESRGRR
jgi:hypothetical protein